VAFNCDAAYVFCNGRSAVPVALQRSRAGYPAPGDRHRPSPPAPAGLRARDRQRRRECCRTARGNPDRRHRDLAGDRAIGDYRLQLRPGIETSTDCESIAPKLHVASGAKWRSVIVTVLPVIPADVKRASPSCGSDDDMLAVAGALTTPIAVRYLTRYGLRPSPDGTWTVALWGVCLETGFSPPVDGDSPIHDWVAAVGLLATGQLRGGAGVEGRSPSIWIVPVGSRAVS